MSFRDCVRIVGMLALLASVPVIVYSFVELHDPFAFAAADSARDLSSMEAFGREELRRTFGKDSFSLGLAEDLLVEFGSELREMYKAERAKATFRVEQRARRRLFAFASLAVASFLVIVVPLGRSR